MRPSRSGLAALLASVLLASGCPKPKAPAPAPAPAPAAEGAARPRNVILMIGDGMGPQELGFLFSYKRLVEEKDPEYARLLEKGTLGLTMTHAFGAIVTDSAAAATAMASGVKTRNGVVGLDEKGNPVPTVLERARRAGKAAGVVSTTRITDATPAAFAAHVPDRGMENAVAAQMLGESRPEVILGGGMRHWIPKEARVADYLPPGAAGAAETSKRGDGRDLLQEARGRGYQVVTSAEELAAASGGTERLLGLFAGSTLRYEIDAREWPTVPSLARMTEAALAALGKAPGGFFLMVEAGRIDHAGHQNDAGALLGEMRGFDEALGVALRFAEGRGDTLLVVAADHETGGGGFSYRAKAPEGAAESGLDRMYEYGAPSLLAELGRRRASFERILPRSGGDPARLVEAVREATGREIALADAERALAEKPATADFADFNRGDGGPDKTRLILLGRALASGDNIVWSTGGHTATPVATAAYGPGAAAFGGLYENTEIAQRLEALFP